MGGGRRGAAVGRVGRNWNFDRIGRSPVEARQGKGGVDLPPVGNAVESLSSHNYQTGS